MATKSTGVNIGSANRTHQVGRAGPDGGVYDIHMVNRGSTTAIIRLGISFSSSGFVNDRYLLYDFELLPNQVETFTRAVLEGNDYIIAQSSAVNVNFIMMGFE